MAKYAYIAYICGIIMGYMLRRIVAHFILRNLRILVSCHVVNLGAHVFLVKLLLSYNNALRYIDR